MPVFSECLTEYTRAQYPAISTAERSILSQQVNCPNNEHIAESLLTTYAGEKWIEKP